MFEQIQNIPMFLNSEMRRTNSPTVDFDIEAKKKIIKKVVAKNIREKNIDINQLFSKA